MHVVYKVIEFKKNKKLILIKKIKSLKLHIPFINIKKNIIIQS
jgi:hypothetical protein